MREASSVREADIASRIFFSQKHWVVCWRFQRHAPRKVAIHQRIQMNTQSGRLGRTSVVRIIWMLMILEVIISPRMVTRQRTSASKSDTCSMIDIKTVIVMRNSTWRRKRQSIKISLTFTKYQDRSYFPCSEPSIMTSGTESKLFICIMLLPTC